MSPKMLPVIGLHINAYRTKVLKKENNLAQTGKSKE